VLWAKGATLWVDCQRYRYTNCNSPPGWVSDWEYHDEWSSSKHRNDSIRNPIEDENEDEVRSTMASYRVTVPQ